jgi:hypothetical protein
LKYSDIPVEVHGSEENLALVHDQMKAGTVYFWKMTYQGLPVAKVVQALFVDGSLTGNVAGQPKLQKFMFTLRPTGAITGIS